MGLFDFFKKDGALSEKAIAKQVKTITNPFTQPDVRRESMDKLVADGSPAAITGLLRRFTATASNTVHDEQEKQWAADALVDLGDVAIEPIKEYIRTEARITYPARALLRLVSHDQGLDFLQQVLDSYGPDDYRSDEIKLQLILLISDHLTPARLRDLLPYLEDHADDVRWAVMDQVLELDRRHEITDELRKVISAALGAQVIDEEFSPRVQRRAAEVLADLEWRIPGDSTELMHLLDEDFFLDKKRYVRRRVVSR